MDQSGQSQDGKELGKISTEWSVVLDPAHFVDRYASAIQKYLLALLKNRDLAEEVAQDFFLWVTRNGFPRAKKERGRFRDYLKVAVRNAALTFLQRKRPPRHEEVDLFELPAPAESQPIPDQEWIAHWRDCLLNRAWQELEKHEAQAPRNPCYTALRVKVANPTEDSHQLAERVSVILGRPIQADAYRKQVSRARRKFAKLLVQEIVHTLDDATADRVEEELIDLGLWVYVRDFLSPDWRLRTIPLP